MKYEKFFHLSQELLCIANLNGQFLDVNETFTKILGYKKQELLAKPYMELVHPDDIEATLQELEMLGQGQPTANFTIRFLCADGSYKWLEWNVTPEVETGNLYASARDISDTVEMTRTLNETQSIAKIGGWKLDAKTNKVVWSKQIYEIYGLPEGQDTNVEIGISQYHPDDQDRISNAVMDAVLEGKSFDLKLRFIRADGEEIWVRSKGNAVRDINGNIEAVQGIFQDIDKEEKTRRQLEANEQTLRQLIRYTPAAVAMFDMDMRYLQHSDQWLVDYGLEGENIIGRSHYEVFPDILEKWKEDHRQVQKGKTLINTEDHWIREDGSEFYISWHLQPWHLSDGSIGGIIMFTRVITEIVKNRLALEKSNEALRRSNLDLEQFAYIASHDMKEPLRMIGNFNQLLLMKYGDKLDDRGMNYLKFSMESVDRLEKLIADILEYSKVGRTEKEMESHDIDTIVYDKMKNLTMLIQEKNASIIIKNLPKGVTCEANQLGVVFYNLLNNALKFNHNSDIEIVVDSRDIGDFYEFSVQDNGIGINPQKVKKIFEPFRRLHRKDKYEGSGIGLSICKKIVQRHDGKIWAESEPGEGTTIKFTIRKMKS